MYDVAQELVLSHGGDPRRLWVVPGRDRAERIRQRLRDVGVRPARTRMILGALYDTRLLREAPPDFKDDIYVRGLMYAFGLSPTTRSDDVLDAGHALFGRIIWPMDVVFWRLGRNDIDTRPKLVKYYNARIRDGRDNRYRALWDKRKRAYGDIVNAAMSFLRNAPSGRGWVVKRDDYAMAIGFTLTNISDGVAHEFAGGSVGTWVGYGFDVTTGTVTAWESVWFSTAGRRAESKKWRDALWRQKYFCDFHDDGQDRCWEEYYRSVRKRSIAESPVNWRRPERQLVRASLNVIKLMRRPL